MTDPKEELLFVALGGSGEIGMNVNLYGCRGKWVMVDLGMTFADPAYPGIDLVLPDLQFIEERRRDLLGVVLTHGHEDHIGAIPYLIEDLDVPLYATAFTAGLIRRKLDEADLLDAVKLNVIAEETPFDLGPFSFRYIPLAHSIPEGNALLIDTPHGRVFHTGDWKLDDEPLIGVPTPAEELSAIGDEGVCALVCDSTNVFNDATSGSEGEVARNLEQVVAAIDTRVVVTTFASNAARLKTLGRVAEATGRTICIAGRSLERIITNAQANGYLTDFPKSVDFETAMDLPRATVMIIATGGQGEPRAALSRIASDSHKLKLDAGDVVLYSSKQIPGNELAIGRIQNQLAEKGVAMITDRQENIHVSGHPGRPDLKAMYGWIRPEIVVPVHGEMRHMQEQARLALSEGIAEAVVQQNGQVVRLAPDGPKIVDHVPTGRLVLDGDAIVPADGATLNERRKLAYNGTIAVAVPIDSKGALQGEPVFQLFGLPLEEDAPDFILEAGEAVRAALRKPRRDGSLSESLRLGVRRLATQWTGKKPVVLVQIVEI